MLYAGGVFTGIVETTAKILKNADGVLTVARPSSFSDIHLGGSICVAGVCLTITAFDESSMSFEVVPETVEKTTLGALKTGDTVNLERSLKSNGRFDGHIVQGHVEGTAEVMALLPDGNGARLRLRMARELFRLCVPKGSVTLDGVSLTVADAQGDTVTVALIPTTLRETTLGRLKEGMRVNVETDILGRYVAALLPQP